MNAVSDAGVKISMVIPAYNEAELLPALLDSIDVAKNRYTGGADAIEVIVGDNNSSDETAVIARSRGCKVALIEKRAIACARNGGAAIADGNDRRELAICMRQFMSQIAAEGRVLD